MIMKTLKFTATTIAIISAIHLNAQSKTTVQEYIETYKDIAIREMERSGIPASITLAQGIHESSYGNSDLSKNSNNHFGIKCSRGWTGEGYYKWDDDPQKSCFRVYESPEQSYIDHTDFLVGGKRYAFLFEYDSKDYVSWANGLRKAGYATDPKYPSKLIHTIEKHNLSTFDNQNSVAIKEVVIDEPIEAKVTTQISETQNLQRTHSSLFNAYKSGFYRQNNTSYAVARKGESAMAFAERFGIPYSRLMKFNDLDKGDALIEYQPLYIQAKKTSFRGDVKTHKVEHNVTMYEIAQYYGVRLSSLYEMNMMSPGEEPINGSIVQLYGLADEKPIVKSSDFLEELSNDNIVAQKVSNPNVENNRQTQEAAKVNIHQQVYADALYNPNKTINSAVSDDSRYLNLSVKTNQNKQTLALDQKALEISKHIGSPITKTTETVGQSKATKHQVKKGDTLYSIHRTYGTAIQEIKELNKLASNEIKVGAILEIPTI